MFSIFNVGDRVLFRSPSAFKNQIGTVYKKLIYNPEKGQDYDYMVRPDGENTSVPVGTEEIVLV